MTMADHTFRMRIFRNQRPSLHYQNFDLKLYEFLTPYGLWAKMMRDLEHLVSAAARAHRKRLSDDLVTLALHIRSLRCGFSPREIARVCELVFGSYGSQGSPIRLD